MATAAEWDAMNSVNPHFTFRERTAFLVGYRKAIDAAVAVAEGAKTDNTNRGHDRRWKVATEIADQIRLMKGAG